MESYAAIGRIRDRMKEHFAFSLTEGHTGEKAAICLRERLKGIPFNAASTALLKEYASPTLRDDFSRAIDKNTANINRDKVALSLTAAFFDPLRKSFMTFAFLTGGDMQGKTSGDFDHDTKKDMISACFSLLHSYRDIAKNMRLVLPEEKTPPDKYDLYVREIENEFIPALQKAVPAFAAELGLSKEEMVAAENRAISGLLEGREHLAPLPARAWQASIQL